MYFKYITFLLGNTNASNHIHPHREVEPKNKRNRVLLHETFYVVTAKRPQVTKCSLKKVIRFDWLKKSVTPREQATVYHAPPVKQCKREAHILFFGHTCNLIVCRTGYKSLQSRHSSKTPQYCHHLRVSTPTEELTRNAKCSERCAGVFHFMQLSFTWFSLVLLYIVSIVLMKNSVRKMYPHLLFKLSSFVLFTHRFFLFHQLH